MFGERLAQIRASKGLSQSELARRAGLSSQAVNRLEHNRNDPQWGTVQRLAAALDIPVAALAPDIAPQPAPAPCGGTDPAASPAATA